MSYSPMAFNTATAGRAGFVRLGTGIGGNADGTIVTSAALLNLTKSSVGLGNVENTALSTWAGSSNISTLGTIKQDLGVGDPSNSSAGYTVYANRFGTYDNTDLNISTKNPGATAIIFSVGPGFGGVYEKGRIDDNTTVFDYLTIKKSSEILNTKTGATGSVDHDFSTGAVWYHSSISSNFTASFSNVPTTNSRAITVSLILSQGSPAYIPNAVSIAGVSQTINWQGGSAPTGNANKIDIVSFTFLRVSSTWTVTGSLTSYG